jgi:hypothetical protein
MIFVILILRWLSRKKHLLLFSTYILYQNLVCQCMYVHSTYIHTYIYVSIEAVYIPLR